MTFLQVYLRSFWFLRFFEIFEVWAENISPATLCDENCQFSRYFDIDISIFQICIIFYQLWEMENVLRE